MTLLLQEAVTKVANRSESEQNAVASILMAELDSERRWEEMFAASQDELSQLADEALREFEAGETLPMDIERDFPHH